MSVSARTGWVAGVLIAMALLLPDTTALASDTKFTYGGYVKLDIMNSLYHNGRVPSGQSPIRDFHLPSQIPVGDVDENFDHHYHVKESRFHLQTDSRVANQPFRAFLEMDFLLSSQGDEKVSNSFNPRMRHFYFQMGKWLFGQTWTTFMIILLPEDLDFSGAAEGIVFGRQPQVRFTWKSWQFSVENSQSTLTTAPGLLRLVSQTEPSIPDVVARHDFKGDWGNLGISAIARLINYKDTAIAIDERDFGFGVSLGTRIKVGKLDDFLLQATAGRGLGRYVALNFVDALAADSTGAIESIDQALGFVGYRHFWTEKLRTSLNASFFYADNPAILSGLGANKEAQSYSINLLYSPFDKTTLGVEVMHARRKLENGVDGAMNRIQLSARYDFGYLSPNAH
jgi:hypothetical protein